MKKKSEDRNVQMKVEYYDQLSQNTSSIDGLVVRGFVKTRT